MTVSFISERSSSEALPASKEDIKQVGWLCVSVSTVCLRLHGMLKRH